MTYFRLHLQLSAGDVEAARTHLYDIGTERQWPSVELGEHISLMPSPGEDLAAALRLLADRVDAAMAAGEPVPEVA